VTDRLRNVSRPTAVTAVAAICLLVSAAVALAGSGFKNGGFETGDLTNWHQLSSGAGAWYVWNTRTTPLSGNAWDGPVDHDFAAVSDQLDAAAGVLYRTIKISSKKVRLTFTVYYRNYALEFCTPASLDPAFFGCNQQFRIDLLRQGADPWSMASGDIVKNVFKTKLTSGQTLEPTTLTRDLSGLGDKVVLRIGWVANSGTLNASVDDVHVDTG
jgi:hypothetical protein